MFTNRWEQIQDVFHAALACETRKRSAFLSGACAANGVLRDEVLALLAHHDPADLLVDDSSATVNSFPYAPGSTRGRRIGHYELLRVIGRGGMGIVYEAVQDHPRRTVALKLMRAGLASRAVLQRFRHEADILARMRHPGIAHVYEAGMVEAGAALPDGEQGDAAAPLEGVPYYAMEYIPQARTLVEYASAAKLTLLQRLELFTAVCDAVQHAHEMGIVHCDLKPANILVDAAGQPKVIDFGVARIADPDLTLATHATGVGQIAGTLQYMSPEQSRGDARQVDARSDVYALGVILFQLLSGDLPYDLDGKSIHDALRAIGEDDPLRLRSISRIFRGDLDTIVAKALEKDKTRRYTHVAQLAEDIRRHLRDQPIVARPASALYQFRKFSRRNRALVAGVSGMLAVSLIGFAVSTVLYAREQTARHAADFRAYVASIAAAQNALRAHDVADARQQLEQAPEALRGWEWRHLAGRLDRSRLTFQPRTREIRCLALSPDGARVALGANDRTARVWDMGSGTALATLGGHTGPIDGVAFSPDGSLLATASDNLTVALWNARTFERIRTLIGAAHVSAIERPHPSRQLHSVDFSPDGGMLVAAAMDGTVRRFELATFTELPIIEAHSDWVTEAVFSPDGRTIASCSYDATIRLWDAQAGQALAPPLEGHKGLIFDVAFSPDGSRLASSSNDNSIRVWDVETRKELFRFRDPSADVRSVAFNSDGSRIVAATLNNTAHVWDLATERQVGALVGHTAAVMDAVFSRDGASIVTASCDGTFKVWDADADDVPTLRGHTAWVYGVAVNPDGTWIASAAGDRYPTIDRTARVWERASGREVARFDHPHAVPAVAFSPKGNWLATGSGKGDFDVQLWPLDSGAPPPPLVGHTDTVWAVAFSPDGTQLASASRDGSVKIWDVATRAERHSLPKHGGGAWCVVYSPDGALIAAGAADRTVKLWKAADGTLVRTLSDPASRVNAVAFSGDGAWLAAGTEGGSWLVWNTAGWALRAGQRGHAAAVNALSFCPDGTRLATGSDDQTIKLWESAGWRSVATLHGHTHDILSLAFSPAGGYLVSGSADCTVRVWDAGSP